MDWLFAVLDWSGTLHWLESILQTQIAAQTIGFTIAAHLHRQWVKKDTAVQFEKIVASIDNVTATVSKDLAAGRERFERIENSVDEIKKFVKFETASDTH